MQGQAQDVLRRQHQARGELRDPRKSKDAHKGAWQFPGAEKIAVPATDLDVSTLPATDKIEKIIQSLKRQ